MNKTVKASIGQGINKIEFKMPIETAEKVIRLKAIIKRTRMETKNKESELEMSEYKVEDIVPYKETMCTPTTKKDAEKRCAKLSKEASALTEYKVLKIATTNKKVTYI
ncbi:MAG: hypothetical protein H6Q12_55 [Bacteroidetes bacterium]|nr:hypothetical protein [Bacteroidota bacterium]